MKEFNYFQHVNTEAVSTIEAVSFYITCHQAALIFSFSES
jgi:hypothetical protein